MQGAGTQHSSPDVAAKAARAADALRAFQKAELMHATYELAHCSAEDDSQTQLDVAEEIESIGHAVHRFGELLVRHDLVNPFSPAARLGPALLYRVQGSLERIRREGNRTSLPETPDPCAPPDPCATPAEIERFLASRASASPGLLKGPFGRDRSLTLVERDHDGYDIWWFGCFFAVRRGRNPRTALWRVRLQHRWDAVWSSRRLVFRAKGRGLLRRIERRAPRAASWLRARLKGWLRCPDGRAEAGAASTTRRPIFGVRIARTALELHGMIPKRTAGGDD